jgi:hypothetical protein
MQTEPPPKTTQQQQQQQQQQEDKQNQKVSPATLQNADRDFPPFASYLTQRVSERMNLSSPDGKIRSLN